MDTFAEIFTHEKVAYPITARLAKTDDPFGHDGKDVPWRSELANSAQHREQAKMMQSAGP